ncbi:MFS transporter [Lacibacterium aquatile]|uniref:MFS transporter n=1 Tax=Lacibacterium aquatile TaxID=1168082 RepID=A0ABW5DNH5_9PROT
MTSPPLFRCLSYGPLASLWIAHVFSALGSEALQLALTWMAAQAGGHDVAALATARFVAAMLVSFLAAGWLDSQTPLRILVGSGVIRAAAALIPLTVILSGIYSFWPLAISTVLVAVAYAAFIPTLQTLVTRLSRDPMELTSANALFDGVPRLGRLVGPPLTGVMLSLMPMAAVLIVSPAFYLASSLGILAVAGSVRQVSQNRPPAPRGWAAVIGGGKAVLRHRPLALLMFLEVMINITWVTGLSVGAPIVIAEQRPDWLGIHGAGALGAIMGAYGVGNVLGTLVLGNMTIKRPVLINRYGSIVLGTGFTLIGIAGWLPNDWIIPVMLVGACIAAPGGPMKDLPTITALQSVLKPDDIGPAFRFKNGVMWGSLLLGSLLVGPLNYWLGVTGGMVAAAVALILAGALSWRVQEIRL